METLPGARRPWLPTALGRALQMMAPRSGGRIGPLFFCYGWVGPAVWRWSNGPMGKRKKQQQPRLDRAIRPSTLQRTCCAGAEEGQLHAVALFLTVGVAFVLDVFLTCPQPTFDLLVSQYCSSLFRCGCNMLSLYFRCFRQLRSCIALCPGFHNLTVHSIPGLFDLRPLV